MKEYTLLSTKLPITDDFGPGMAQTDTPNMNPRGLEKKIIFIHSRYQLKPITNERVYPTEYEITHNRRLDPWGGPD